MKKSNPLFFKALSVVMALAMILSVVSASFAVSAESTEIVLNNKTAITFEDGKFPAGVTGSARGTTSIVAAPAAGHGNYSLKRTYKPELPAEKDNDTSMRINVAFKAGRTYKISFYYYFVPNTEQKANYLTWFVLANSASNLYKGSWHDPEKEATYNTWKKFEQEFTFEQDFSYVDLIVSRCDAYFDDINIVDLTLPEEDLYLHTDFSDITTTEWLPLRAGENANLRYVNDADEGVVAVCDVPAGLSSSNMLYIPKKLEAGKEYIIQIRIKVSGWTCAYYNGIGHSGNADQNSDGDPMFTPSNTSWDTITKTISSDSDQYFYLGSTSAQTIYLSKVILREKNNSESKQVYDLDTTKMGEVYGTTFANAVAEVNNADGMANKAIKRKYPIYTDDNNSNNDKTELYGALEHKLVAGNTYKLTMDYTGEAVLRLFMLEAGWSGTHQIISKNKPASEVYTRDAENYGLKTAAGEWKKLELYFTATGNWGSLLFVAQNTNSTYFADFAGNTDIYLDNITIENVATYSVSLGEYENGTATVSATTGIIGNTDVTFTATANAGYVFTGWKDAEGNVISTNATYTVKVNADVTLTPVFEAFKSVVYDFEDGNAIAGDTNSGSFEVAESINDENGTYSLKHNATSSFANYYFKSVKLLAGHTYLLSYDYYADSSVADGNNYWQRMDLWSADGKTLVSNSPTSTSDDNRDKWLTTGRRVTATEDGQFFGILCSGEMYFDNVVIIDITSGDEYTYDTSEKSPAEIIDMSIYAEITYENDATLGKDVAVVEFNRPAKGGFDSSIALPFTPANGVTYRVRMTVKTEGWFTATYDGKNADGASGVNSANWTTWDWYVTGSETNNLFYIGTNEKDGKIYIADISVEIEKAKGDVNNDGTIVAEDLSLLRQTLLGIKNSVVFKTACDLDDDGEINIVDLVKLKKNISGISDIVDEASTLKLLAASNNVELEYSESSATNLGDGSRFKKAVSGQDAYVIYRVAGGITEAVVEYDTPKAYMGEFTYEVSNDMLTWENVSLINVAGEEISAHGWIKYTTYLGKIGGSKYLKINFPSLSTNGKDESVGIRKVFINGINDRKIFELKGYKSNLRAAQTFYIDSVNGNDDNNGLSTSTAFKTIEKAFARTFVPGDKILFARGATYSGAATIYSSGAENAPIVIGAYGEGAKPIINGFADDIALDITGDYIEISDLEFTCPEGIVAIKFKAVRGGAHKGVKISNCHFHDINSLETSTRFLKRDTGGVAFCGLGNTPSWFEDTVVENNVFNTLGRGSVFFTTEWSCVDTVQGAGTDGNGKDAWGNRNFLNDIAPVRHKNITVRNNSITANAGDAILLIGAEDSVIEYNTVANSILIGDRNEADPAWASIWYHSSHNCVIQHNEVYGNSGANGGHDLQAFDLDIACTNCVVQYNYSHDNDGGFMLLCGTESENGGAVKDCIVRYNLSVNDGAENYDVIVVTGSIENTQIYNNTIYCGKNNVKLVNFANYQKVTTLSTGNVFTNNIFYAADGVNVSYGYGDKKTTPALADATFNNNVFYNIAEPGYEQLITVTNSKTADPLLTAVGPETVGRDTGNAYKPTIGSYVLTDGVTISDNGGKDYFGNEIPADSTLIGAING